MIPTKTKTPLMFTWTAGLGKDVMVQVGNYNLYVWIRAGFWHWQIYHNGKVSAEGRQTGWRRQSTAQHQAELYYHKNYGKTST